jgi:peptidyl-tRNA hydrolase
MDRIKILVRKNLDMSKGKQSAQSVHAALGLMRTDPRPYWSCVVLEVSDQKFEEAKLAHHAYVVRDGGYTEVEPGTETAMAFYEPDPRKT